MPKSGSAGALKGALVDILKGPDAQPKAAAARKAEAYFRLIAGRDYDAALKGHFKRRELSQMLKDVRKTLPTLNREIYRKTELGHLSDIAAKLGVTLQTHALPGEDGAGFRGFYINKAERLKRPLIWVNTAAPPAATAAAFWHEIGHHLTNRIWGKNQTESMPFGGNFRDHLADPKEIAADMVRVLGGYPQPIAQRLFGGADMEQLRTDPDLLVSKALSHVRAVMGFDFQGRFSPQEDLCYLGGMIHTAKLRMTLLSEYGI
jgi:hypothetical protein